MPVSCLLAFGSAGCDNATSAVGDQNGTGDQNGSGLHLSSTAFSDGSAMPERFTADGDDVSPPLAIENEIDGAVSLALIVDDPDAPGDAPFIHWVLYGLPADVSVIPEGATDLTLASIGNDVSEGRNGFGNIGYGGPAPPPDDDAHTYRFMLFALDSVIDAEEGLSAAELQALIDDITVASAVLTGTYDR